ncbi:MAG TPA: LysR substrate-binding domain-containing protein [Steroidobacteraceae bacterium]
MQGQDWKALAELPWLATAAQSAHHRLLASVFGLGSLTGLEPPCVALIDQEASMLDLVKSGAGLSLMRESIAIRESQAHGLAIADKVGLDCALSFVCLRARRDEPVIAAAWNALEAHGSCRLASEGAAHPRVTRLFGFPPSGCAPALSVPAARHATGAIVP